MTRSTIPAVLIAVFLCGSTLAQEQVHRLPETTIRIGTVKHVTWTAWCKRQMFDFSRVELSYRLNEKASAKQVVFSEQGLIFKIRLTREGGPAVVRDYLLKHWSSPDGGMLERDERYSEKDNGWFCHFQIDLTSIFGHLAPGQYTAQVALRTDSFTLDGELISDEAWLLGPSLQFATTALDVSTIFQPNPDAAVNMDLIDIDQWELSDEGGYWPAKITNRSNQSIRIHAYTDDRDVQLADFVVCPYYSRQYHPGTGWEPNRWGVCGTGLGGITIPPGGSQHLSVSPIGERDGNGVYRYVIPYEIVGDDGKPAVRSTAPSFPLLVRDGKVMPLHTANRSAAK